MVENPDRLSYDRRQSAALAWISWIPLAISSAVSLGEFLGVAQLPFLFGNSATLSSASFSFGFARPWRLSFSDKFSIPTQTVNVFDPA